MTARVFIGLILCNLVWSANPLMGKLLMRAYSPAQASVLRYVSALLAYLLFAWFKRHCGSTGASNWSSFLLPTRKRDWGWILAIGFFTFCFSPLMQMSGLRASRAVDNSLIIAMEPLMTVMLAWMILRERLKAYQLGAFALALTGFAFLTGITPDRLAGIWDPHLIGNLLVLASLIGEALYSPLARKLMIRYQPSEIFGSSLAAGTLILVALVGVTSGIPVSMEFSTETVISILWLGPLGTALTYFFWMMALSKAPIASMALTLFIQPLAGALWGFAFLGERLTQAQTFGGLLILLAVSAPALREAGAARS